MLRLRVLLLVVVALVVAGSAGAAPGAQPKHVRVVKRHGALTATVTYRVQHRATGDVTLAIRRNGQLLLEHRLCPPRGLGPTECDWLAFRSLAFRQVGGRTPAVIVNLYWSWDVTFIAFVGPRPHLIRHDWFRAGYLGHRLNGHYYFVSGDNRFMCRFASCAASWLPSQTWAVRAGRLVNVTKDVGVYARANAKRAWRWYIGPHGRRSTDDHGIGIFAGWCADEYILERGSVCQRVLRRELAAGRLRGYGVSGQSFARRLNRDLVRWGYKHRQ